MNGATGLSPRQRWAFGLAVAVLASVGLAGICLLFGWPLDRHLRTLEVRDPRYPCGNLCIATVSHLLDRPVTLRQTTRVLPVDPEGISSLLQVRQALEELGFAARGVQFTRLAALGRSSWPAILHVRQQHFVVALPARGGRVVILDPPREPRGFEPSQLRKQWGGVCLLVCVLHCSWGS